MNPAAHAITLVSTSMPGASLATATRVAGGAALVLGAAGVSFDPWATTQPGVITGPQPPSPPPPPDARTGWVFGGSDREQGVVELQSWSADHSTLVAEVGDLDGDGLDDLWRQRTSTTSSTQSVLFGTPDGFPDTPAWSPSIVSSYID